jgi:outer membrane receptor protein involved in Fe transport
VGNIVTGVVDVSQLPQDLFQRVDTVFGGASAAYGSDALAGVVNIVLDTKYDGIKGEMSGGITNYGDARSWKVALTAGTGFLSDRGHIEVSGDAEGDRGILGTDPQRRSWDSKGNMMMNNPLYGTGPGQSTSVPQMIAESQVGLSNAAVGGLITSGPLKGTLFGPGGSISQLVYGPIISDPLMSGGGWRATNQQTRFAVALDPRTSRQNIFGRVSYAINGNMEVYAQAQWGHSHEISTSVANFFTGSIVVKNDNPLIPAPIAASMAAQGITSFQFGTMNGDISGTTPTYDRSVNREAIGVDGDFQAFGTSWKWDAHGSYGYDRGTSSAANTILTAAYNNAIDVVRNPTTGLIVCRSTLTNPTNGCVPYNLFGTGVNSQAALDYVTGQGPTNPGGHFYRDHLIQTVEGANISGEPFSLWAGPVSIATGIEHRKETTGATADPGEAAQAWLITSGTPFNGSFSVTEGYVETVVPLAKNYSWADSLDLDVAARFTGYSTFGTAETWKVGLNYTVGDLHFRATESRDLREPTLVDLYSTPVTVNFQVADPFVNNQNVTYIGVTSGNPKLKPEKAYSTGLGVVYQPGWLSGFSVSFDYYQVAIAQVIASYSATQLLQLCFNKVQTACDAVSTIGTDNKGLPILQINTIPQNFASEKTKGFDIESSYRLSLSDVFDNWKGNIAFHMLLTHAISDVQNSGAIGTIPLQRAGENGGSAPPHYKLNASLNYNRDPVNIGLTVRAISSGKINNSWITCTTGCPVSTANHLTTNQNHIAGAIYFDLNTTYFIPTAEGDMELFFNIRNLFNLNPPVYYVGPNNNSWQTYPANGQDYDILGRVFRAGVRFAF